VAYNRLEDHLYVLGGHVVLAFKIRKRLSGPSNGKGRSGACTHQAVRRPARLGNKPDNVTQEIRCDMNVQHLVLCLKNLRGCCDRLKRIQRVCELLRFKDTYLLLLLRVSDLKPHQEPIQLRLRKRISAVLLDRILCGDYKIKRAQRPGFSIGGNLALLHALKKRSLSAGRSPVDFIRKNNFCEDRAGSEDEFPGFLVVDRNSCYIRGEKIRCELYALEACLKASGKAFCKNRLAHPGHILKEEVAPRKQSDDSQADHPIFPDYHLLHILFDPPSYVFVFHCGSPFQGRLRPVSPSIIRKDLGKQGLKEKLAS